MRRFTQQLADGRSSRTVMGAERKWFRALTALCILLVSLGACVQACHVHDRGGPPPWKTSQRNAPGSTPTSPPDHCPLCVAMQAAMPSTPWVAPVPIRHVQRAIVVELLPRRMRQVSFDLFSRPPPAALA